MKSVVFASLIPSEPVPKSGKSILISVNNQPFQVQIKNVKKLDKEVFIIEDEYNFYLTGNNSGIAEERPILNKCFILRLRTGLVKIPHIISLMEYRTIISGYSIFKLRTLFTSYVVCMKQ